LAKAVGKGSFDHHQPFRTYVTTGESQEGVFDVEHRYQVFLIELSKLDDPKKQLAFWN
jgi:hypothetical protein